MRGELTNCQAHREGQVRTLKETERARGTHELSSTQGGSSKDTERNRACEALTNCQAHREGQVRTLKETERARGTHGLSSQQGGQVWILKETECARGTHNLSSTQGGSSQDTDRN